MKAIKQLLALMGVLAVVGGAQASCYEYNANATATLDATTQINSKDRFLILKGTVNLNAGASVVCGGDQTGTCNYIGVDQNNQVATLNVNGGTFWCSKANGAGYLKISANANNQVATLTINSGSVTVDTAIWTCTYWNSNSGSTGRGIINVNGGALTVGTLYMGADSSNTGSTEIYLADGTFSVKAIDFRAFNKQLFQWKGGTLKALQSNIFNTSSAYSGTGGRTIEVLANTTSVFDNNTFNQVVPPLTGTGTLRLVGDGSFSFQESALTYKLETAYTTLSLGTANASTPLLTMGGAFTISGPTRVELSLPTGATGRYPIFANCGAASAYAVSSLLTSPHGTFVLDNGTIYLDVGAAPADGLVYSAAAGGDDTPDASSYTYASFLPTAGAFNVNEALTLSGTGVVLGTTSASTQTMTGAVTFANANAGIFTAENSTLVLKGGLTATTPVKDGPGTLVLDTTTVPASMTVKEGTIDFNGKTVTSSMQFAAMNGNGRTITFKHGTLNDPGEEWNVRCGYEIHLGEGFNLNMTADKTGRLTFGWLSAWPRDEANLYLDPGCGTITLRGDSAGRCNFITPDASASCRIVVSDGVLHSVRSGSAAGCFRIATGTNPMTKGTLKVVGGEVVVDWDLMLATLYNSLQGGAGTAEVDLESGTMRVGHFYLGGSSTAVGKGTIRLTGGDLYVKMLKCLDRCTQTLVCDGARIHAQQDSTDDYPFLTALASADNYAKSYTIGEGGLLLDTAGYQTTCNLPFAGAGGLTVAGAGTLTYSGASAFTGGVVVSNGTTVAFTDRRTFSAVTLDTNAKFGVKAVEGADITVTGNATFAADAKLVVDVSALECAQSFVRLGGAVLPEGANLVDFVEVKDATAPARYATSVADDGKTIVLTCIDRTNPYYAVWKGEGEDPTNVADPANWSCFDAMEEPLANVIPNEYTTVRLTGATMFSVPAAQALTVKALKTFEPVTLTGDCDWRGLGVLNVSEDAAIDLKGHKLYVTSLAGTGTITDTSVDYVRLEALDSTGTQWIDTGIQHGADTTVDMRVRFDEAPSAGGWVSAFGARLGNSGDATTFGLWLYNNNKLTFWREYGDGNRIGDTGIDAVLGHDYEIHLAKNGTCTADGVVLGTGAGGSSAKNDYLFCLNDNGTARWFSNIRLYSCKIYSGSQLVRDFVPMRRVSTGESGLWDLQSQAFFPNSGTGKFLGILRGTDVTAYGELHVDVPADVNYDLGSVTLKGALKLVKDGAGTIRVSKAQSYCGGTRVAAGTMLGTGHTLGDYGTTVTVDAGATFDVAGIALSAYDYVLNGGTLANTVSDVGSGSAQTSYIRLTADSFVNAPLRMGMVGWHYEATTIDLNGHTLTVDAPLDFFLANTDITPGTFKMISGFLWNNTAVRGSLADFDLDCVLTLYVDSDMHDLTYRWVRNPRPGTSNAYGNGKVRVFGTFTPLTPKFHNVEMQNGSILNLADQTTVWSTTSTNVDNGSHKATFATGATVTVEMGTRRVSDEWVYVIEWGSAGVPANLDTLTFKASGRYAAGAVVVADATGVKMARFGMIFFVR